MSLVKGKFARLSLRAKFKTPTAVEIVVVDHETQQTWCIMWNFAQQKVEQTETAASKDAEVEEDATDDD